MSEATYSQIIDPEKYIKLMNQHVYIPESDKVISGIVKAAARILVDCRIAELGCGPGRISHLLAQIPKASLACFDQDSKFIDYAINHLDSQKMFASFVTADIVKYDFKNAIGMFEVFVSQGVHHHIAKSETQAYLQNVRRGLPAKGIYVLSDEFLPHYDSEEERRVRAVIWYSHVIHCATSRHQYHELAREEAKTLLDDLSAREVRAKSEEQIKLVEMLSLTINMSARTGDLGSAEEKASVLLSRLPDLANSTESDPSMRLSRGDYKICHAEFQKEVDEAGFKIISVQTVGPISTIGGMAVYVLRKN